jgi:hypothetical protein
MSVYVRNMHNIQQEELHMCGHTQSVCMVLVNPTHLCVHLTRRPDQERASVFSARRGRLVHPFLHRVRFAF